MPTTARTPWHTALPIEGLGVPIISSVTGQRVGFIRDPQDADLVVELVNGNLSLKDIQALQAQNLEYEEEIGRLTEKLETTK